MPQTGRDKCYSRLSACQVFFFFFFLQRHPAVKCTKLSSSALTFHQTASWNTVCSLGQVRLEKFIFRLQWRRATLQNECSDTLKGRKLCIDWPAAEQPRGTSKPTVEHLKCNYTVLSKWRNWSLKRTAKHQKCKHLKSVFAFFRC